MHEELSALLSILAQSDVLLLLRSCGTLILSFLASRVLPSSLCLSAWMLSYVSYIFEDEGTSLDTREPSARVWMQTHISGVLRAQHVLRRKVMLRLAQENAPKWMAHTAIIDPLPSPESEMMFLRAAQKVENYDRRERREREK